MSPIKETPATPPKLTRSLARVLPARLRFLACGGVHTISAGYGDCAVCGADWTLKGKRRWLRFYGTRSPQRRGRPSETTLHVLIAPWLELHRVQYWREHHRWLVSWHRKGDQHRAHLRPSVSFSHENVSARIRMERREQELMVQIDAEQDKWELDEEAEAQ